ncbi:phenylacetate-CoA oxygenase subunit PaaJ [Natronosporangium hydrolyticum]|uniref:Phenylacetate-CoA oxygenase subunit PaaJ n=1 Tax=Natronosporangium hydrolyticum TaxID=2811111 RepID=A0A895YFW3_9ACTN|nr:1,2-phenylacetyl-CoA epoxidase subunit PaaD [Natronosporangium hydrolyticum]QSB14359.1 phenylacetate-CoA oxygenase subunit PaaJ [Natronosporangium hydrolyticum]
MSGEPAYQVAARVVDPELRVVTIDELGILRSVERDGGQVVVTITPTYSGCPAMEVIRADIETSLRDAGWPEVTVVTQLSPAWTTDWLSDSGRAKLAAAGIAPPGPVPADQPLSLGLPTRREAVACPQCGSTDTTQLSRFGATACKALWRCDHCAEPFEQMKAF